MPYTYDSEIEEDDGYSIPKILVAVLLLVLIGAGVYIYFQQKKLENSVTYLIDSKKQVEQDLNAMIEKYNLAIDNNGDLESDLEEQRDRIIRFRDSISKIKEKDKKEIKSYEKTITKLKQEGSIEFENVASTSSTPDLTTENAVGNDISLESGTANIEEKPLEKEGVTDVSIIDKDSSSSDSSKKEIVEKVVKKEEPVKTDPVTTFRAVEVPPTYPGCSGSAAAKKDCFSQKIKKLLYRKFDASIVDEINLSSGKKRILVSFNVDRFGRITRVRARGPHKKLEEEAVRVVKKIPKMLAARQNGKPVAVSYSIPITVVVP